MTTRPVSLAEVEARLHDETAIWLVTVGAGGRPHVAPVWFSWDGRRLWFATGRTSVKARNLLARPHARAHLADPDDAVILTGIAVPATGTAEAQVAAAGYVAKYARITGRAPTTPPGSHDLLFRLDVARITAWRGGDPATRLDVVPGT